MASRPPWPPTDGGRVLMAYTIEGLVARGHDITVVAPTPAGRDNPAELGAPVSPRLRLRIVPDRPPPKAAAAVLSLIQGLPVSVVGQSSPPTRVEVARLLGTEPFDVVHVEQLQALPKADAAFGRRVPIVLRAENVESDLWHALAEARPRARRFARFEAQRLARFEGRSVARVAATAALTLADAKRLRRLAPGADVEVVPAPMPAHLPAGAARLAGDPALVVVASRWHPNQDGVIWFAKTIWPAVLAALPRARLHLFGADAAAAGDGIDRHEAATSSADAFADGSILVVPLRIASGVRVRILEAWARGVPVVATHAAAEGLGVVDGRGIRLADSADAFIRAIDEIHQSRDLSAGLVIDGRARLKSHHDPAMCAARLEAIYARVIG